MSRILALVLCLLACNLAVGDMVADSSFVDCTVDGRTGYEDYNTGGSAQITSGMRNGEERRFLFYTNSIPEGDVVCDSARLEMYLFTSNIEQDSLCFDLRRIEVYCSGYFGAGTGGAATTGECSWNEKYEGGVDTDTAWGWTSGDFDSVTSYGTAQVTAADDDTFKVVYIDTALVNGWIRGDFENYGIALDFRNVTGSRNDMVIATNDYTAAPTRKPRVYYYYSAAPAEKKWLLLKK